MDNERDLNHAENQSSSKESCSEQVEDQDIPNLFFAKLFVKLNPLKNEGFSCFAAHNLHSPPKQIRGFP